MDAVVPRIGAAILVFVSTNIDDIVLLSALFAEPRLRAGTVVAGQVIGIGILFLGSALASVAAVAIPAGWTSLLGIFPLLLGLFQAVRIIRSRRSKDQADETAAASLHIDGRFQILSVVGVTLANGGDNVGVYVPLFAASRDAMVLYAGVFAVMTALWCALGYLLVNNRVFGAKLRRYGHVALPFVLIGLGVYILLGARALLH